MKKNTDKVSGFGPEAKYVFHILDNPYQNGTMVNFLIVDDHDIVREGIKNLLETKTA